MRKIMLMLVTSSLALANSAAAATWNYISAGNDRTLYFFDADTVERSPGNVTLWVKTVQTRQPDTDGSWASALRWKLNCSARTIQTLAWSTYNNSGEFISSNNNPSKPQPVIPDSIGEAVLKIACEADFPRNTSGKNYFKLDNNDVFKARDNWVNYQNSHTDLAPE